MPEPKLNAHWLRHFFCRGCGVRLYQCPACPYCGGHVVDISGSVRIDAVSHDDELQRMTDAGRIHGQLTSSDNRPGWGSWRDS